MARHKDCEAVVTGIVGCAGLAPTVAAIQAGKDICLANKETLIAGARLLLRPLSAAHPWVRVRLGLGFGFGLELGYRRCSKAHWNQFVFRLA